jgi:uncharacterized membrane protein YkvA (DUF1232 family)
MMVTNVIRDQIKRIFDTPGFDGVARQRIRELSGAAALDPAKEDRLIGLLCQYVERAPQLLEACYGAAQQAGVANEAAPILEAAARYFLEPQDFIPDQMGLYGLLDDAYQSNRFVERTSELYQHYAGRPLLALDLSSMNAVARSVIGEPLASQLDQVVDTTVQSIAQQIQLLAQQRQQFQVSPTGGPGAWGGTWEDEMSRTGAELGISINW